MTNSAITPEIITGEGYASDVILPASFADIATLNPIKIRYAKQCVKAVNENYIEAGRLIIDSCRELYELKSLLVGKEWIAFVNSGALPLNEKKVRDMCKAWEGWLSKTEMTDGELLNVGTRTMAQIAGLPPAEQEEATRLIKANRKKEARKLVEAKRANADEALAKAEKDFKEASESAKLSLFASNFEKAYRTEERIDAKNKSIEDLKGKIGAKDKKIAELEARLQKAVVGGEWNLQTTLNSRTKASQEVSV
jgi:hypothetical protein